MALDSLSGSDSMGDWVDKINLACTDAGTTLIVPGTDNSGTYIIRINELLSSQGVDEISGSQSTNFWLINSKLAIDSLNSGTGSQDRDVTTVAYEGLYDASATLGTQGGLFFSPDGLNMFCGHNGDYIVQYNLTTPFDVTSGVSHYLTTGWSNTYPTAMYITPDGLTVISSSSSLFYEHTLGSAWDITSVTQVQTMNFGYASNGIWFNDDGTIMITGERFATSIRKYALTTPYDISTATLDETVVPGDIVGGIYVSKDGEHLIVHHSTGVLSDYQLTNPWTLTGLTTFGTGSVPSAYSIYFDEDTGKLFTLDGGEHIEQYFVDAF